MRRSKLGTLAALTLQGLIAQACLVVDGGDAGGSDAGPAADGAGSDVDAGTTAHDASLANFVVSCSLPRPELGALDDVTATAQTGCVMNSGDSIQLQRVASSEVPLVDGTTLYVSGDFVLASQASAEIRLFVNPGNISNCVAGVATGPAGQFEVWGQVSNVPDGGTSVISVDFAYGTTSTDCRHELTP